MAKWRQEDMLRAFRGLFNVRRGRASHKIIRRRVEAAAQIDGIHMFQLIAAMIIASIGLNVNSTEAIIGSMLICPLMGTAIAIAYGIASLDMHMLRHSIGEIVVQFLVCLLTSTVYFLISPLSTTTSSLLTNATPTIWDVMIALVGGFAGALCLSRQEEPTTLLAGVAVATALMPPLCATGYGLALRDVFIALSALYEFLVNVVFIAFGAEIVFALLLRVPLLRDLDGDGKVTEEERRDARERSHQLRMRLVLGSIVFALPCVFFSAQLVNQAVEQNGTVFEVQDEYSAESLTRELAIICPQFESFRIGEEDSYDLEKEELVTHIVATVVTSEPIDDAMRQEIEQIIQLHVEDIYSVTFTVRSDTIEPKEHAAEGVVTGVEGFLASQPETTAATTEAAESPAATTEQASTSAAPEESPEAAESPETPEG